MVPAKVFRHNNEPLRYDNEYKIIKGYIDNQQLSGAFNYLSMLRNKLGSSIEPVNQLIINVLLCRLQAQSNKIHENLSLISLLEGTVQDPLMNLDFSIAKAETLWKSGKQSEALKTIETLENMFSNFKENLVTKSDPITPDILDRESDILNLKGIINWLLGDVQIAQHSFQQSLNLREKLLDKKKIAGSLNNLGIVYTYQGELQPALDKYNRVVELLQDSPNKEDLSSPYANIGEIYQYMGQFGYALDFYNLSLDLLEKTDDKINKAKIYSLILSLHVESNNLPEAQIFLEKMKPLDDPIGENSHIHTLYILSEGLILKHSDSLMKKFKSGENFLQVANAPVVDSDLTARAIFNLNDILLLETKLSKNENRLVEVQSWLDKLITIAKNQKSSVLLIQCYILDSKLKLLEFKVKDAKKILSQAQDLANEKGLKKFEYLIAFELNQLLSREQEWIDLRVKGASIEERIDLAGLEQTLDNLIHKRQDKSELIELIKKSIAPSIQELDPSPQKNELIMENFYKYISDRTYITIYRMGDIGPVIYLSDELKFSNVDQELLEIKLGVYFTTAIGQGDNSNVGLFGPLPFPDSSDYVSIVYSCFMVDPEHKDPRGRGHSYCLFIVTFPKLLEPYYDNKHFLNQLFEKFQKNFSKIQDITRKDLDELRSILVK